MQLKADIKAQKFVFSENIYEFLKATNLAGGGQGATAPVVNGLGHEMGRHGSVWAENRSK